MDQSIKQYAESLYEKALMESVALLGRQSRDYLLEKSKRQDPSQLFSGIDFQNLIRIYADHIERCTVARLDSYQKAYVEIARNPTEIELNEVFDDCKSTWEILIRHSNQALSNFLASRNAPEKLDADGGLRAASAHGHDRVLREWKIWRSRILLQASTSQPEKDKVPSPISATQPNLDGPKVPMSKGAEKQGEPRLRKVSYLAAHGLIALFIALVLGALTVFGIVNANLGHVLWFLAWVVGSLFILGEIIPEKGRAQKGIVLALFGMVIVGADIGALKLKRQQEIADRSKEQAPIGHQAAPPNGLGGGTQPNTETHGTTDSVEPKVGRHGTSDGVTTKVDHSPSVLKFTFQDSPALTSVRRNRISKVLNNYYNYLTSELGLDLPRELSPIGVSAKGAVSSVGGSVGAPPYYSHIIISEDSIDSDDAVRTAYSMSAFQGILQRSPQGPSPEGFRGEALWVFSCYFASSFGGKRVCAVDIPAGKWIETMWEVRREYGKNYSDKVLGFTLKMWSTSSPGNGTTFDQFFMNKLTSGETAVNGDSARFTSVRQIAKRNGVQID